MVEPLFTVSGLKVALPDMTRKPLIGRAPLIEILKGLRARYEVLDKIAAGQRK